MQRILFALVFFSILFSECKVDPTPSNRILVFSKTETYRPASIDAGIDAIKKLCLTQNILADFTESSSAFTEEELKNYSAVVFLNTSGDVLNNTQQADFQRFIEAGGGFVGVHGAAATEYDWHWYGRLVGAYFADHTAMQKAKVLVTYDGVQMSDELPNSFEITDEWYNFRQVPPTGKVWTDVPNTTLAKTQIGPVDSLRQLEKHIDPRVAWTYDFKDPFFRDDASIQVLLEVDETSYKGGKHGQHPISWAQEYEGGRSFYTGLGHTVESYGDANFLKHLTGGIKYAIGTEPLDYSKTKTKRIPDEERFVRTILADNLNEPMELEILPDNRLVFIERRGAMKIYDPKTESLETVLQMPLYTEFEEGFLGMALDPNWEENQWVYLYYSLMEGGRRNRLSRFVFDGKMLHIATEKMMLEVPELKGCCHTGGSIEFGPGGEMFLSTGDNTNPFESAGYGPFDERPGRALWDAQKSSANPNDLRGKILRIVPQPDGGYAIPEGNLFPEGTPGTRPEIYVMGCRNPFRISIDSKTGCVFWGDVGPDAGKDGQVRGPKGYDTFNRACEAGFYGWPYARGNHIYQDYNFATQRSGTHFDPENIQNDSPNNTGKVDLPPVQHPLIWYSYDESTEFPWTGIGGKNPMAGPVFHKADFMAEASVFPDYFEDKFFAYEWMRDWIFVVTLDENGQYVTADPFLPNESFHNPMDMAFGPDGALYILEYGESWFSQNLDARLNKIEFAPNNRKPVARIITSKTKGATPIAIKFSGSESEDYDGDKLKYEWNIKDLGVTSTDNQFEYIFKRPGIYEVVLKVTDTNGAFSKSKSTVEVGNEPPSVFWNMGGNKSFYWDHSAIEYEVTVMDKEDGNSDNPDFESRRLNVSIDYLKEGKDIAEIVMGHQMQDITSASLKYAGGKLLIEKSDCKTCHHEVKKINGPSYADIATRYFEDKQALTLLADKIIAGGGGNWGETNMAAHPQITKEAATEMVQYILSLSGEELFEPGLPKSGTYIANAHIEAEEKGAYLFQATYTDKGADGANKLSASKTVVLKYPILEAESMSSYSKGIQKIKDVESGNLLVKGLLHDRYISFEQIDLTGIDAIAFLFFQEKHHEGTAIEIRLDSHTGKNISKGNFTKKGRLVYEIVKTTGMHELFIVFKNEEKKEQELGMLDWVEFLKLD